MTEWQDEPSAGCGHTGLFLKDQPGQTQVLKVHDWLTKAYQCLNTLRLAIGSPTLSKLAGMWLSGVNSMTGGPSRRGDTDQVRGHPVSMVVVSPRKPKPFPVGYLGRVTSWPSTPQLSRGLRCDQSEHRVTRDRAKSNLLWVFCLSSLFKLQLAAVLSQQVSSPCLKS